MAFDEIEGDSEAGDGIAIGLEGSVGLELTIEFEGEVEIEVDDELEAAGGGETGSSDNAGAATVVVDENRLVIPSSRSAIQKEEVILKKVFGRTV